MPTITLLKYASLPNVWEIAKLLNNKKFENGWITAYVSKYNRNEVFANYWHYEDMEDGVKRVFSENDAEEIVNYLKQNGKTRVLKRTYCFVNTLTRTFEIYRGPDRRTDEMISNVEKTLNTKFEQVTLKAEQLHKIYSSHSTELTQVMFKNIQGLFYEILRGKYLENNEKYREYLRSFYQSLRIISFRPKIKFLNGNNKYQVTLNGDKGTIRISSNGDFVWRPRYEIRQIIFMVAATAGLLPS